jgi:hypothetical protein
VSDDHNGNGHGDLPPDELQERRDRAVSPKSFRRWLMTQKTDPRFVPLWEAMRAASEREYGSGGNPTTKMFPSRFDRETYAKALDYDEDLLEILIQAEAEWRVDVRGQEGLAKKLEIDTTSAFDFRNPAQGQAQFCRFQIRSGGGGAMKLCREPAVNGTVRCMEHGGELVNAETRRAVLMSSYLQLVEATGIAVDTLINVALDSRNDLARVQAAREILDRAGLTAELNVTIKLEGEERSERMTALREKLDSMQRGLTAQVIETTAT